MKIDASDNKLIPSFPFSFQYLPAIKSRLYKYEIRHQYFSHYLIPDSMEIHSLLPNKDNLLECPKPRSSKTFCYIETLNE